MAEWPVFRCRGAGEPGAERSLARPGAKLLHFLRHGESLHQVRAEQGKPLGRVCRCHARPTPEERAACPYYDADLVDSPLTEPGRRQVAGVGAGLRAPLWLAGAATRSLETARAAAGPGARIVALDQLRSRVSPHMHTRRRPISVLAPLFPEVDFALVRDDEDGYFTGCDETREALDRRVADFLRLLAARPEPTVAIVTHFTIFLTLFQTPAEELVIGRNAERPADGPAFFDCRDAADPEKLRSFFAVGEVRSLAVEPAP